MAAEGSRGTVGIVRPTQRTGGFEELLRILPQGIRLIPLALDVQRGALDEFQAAIPAYEAKVAELAKMGVDVINPSGAPPFMVLGYANEQDLIRRWEDAIQHAHVHLRHQQHRRHARAEGDAASSASPISAATSTRSTAQYFVDAGFECLDMAGIDVDFAQGAGAAEQHGSTTSSPDAFRRNRSRRGGLHAWAGLAYARHRRAAGDRTWACRCSTRCRCNAGTSSATSASASRCAGSGA